MSSTDSFIIGVDLGGTNIVVGAITEDGAHRGALHSDRTRADLGADAVVERIGALIDRVIAETAAQYGVTADAFVGVGIGSPGPLDRATGVVLMAPNLGWTDFPLRERVAARSGLPATLDNDAKCATLGEWWLGAAKGARYVLGITLGTGIGGGFILDGRLFHGASDVAGEIGHMTIDPTGRRCNCGNYGCLEAYASGPAIAQRALEAMERGAKSSLRVAMERDPSLVTAQTVYAAAAEGDVLAREITRDTAKFLGVGVANLLNVFNPDVVVLAGGVAQAGDSLFEPLRAEVALRAFRPAVEACRIVPGALGGAAGVFGAAATFRQQRPSH